MPLPGWHADFARAPLFRGLDDVARPFAAARAFPELAWLNRLAEAGDLRNARDLPVRFVAQGARCSQRDYEDGIHASGRVPTRADNWHDFFNALIWLAYPRSKRALNACQHAGLRVLHDGRRGPVSDAATLFDESGVILIAPDAELATQLRAKQWRNAFWEQRERWQQARLVVFGHSLLEKALALRTDYGAGDRTVMPDNPETPGLAPTPGITGKCLAIEADLPEDPVAARSAIDARVASAWEEGQIRRPADLFPLPVFGIPGYHPGNGDPAFYANTQVFRPPRNEATAPSRYSDSPVSQS
jgi:hypothetical protein